MFFVGLAGVNRRLYDAGAQFAMAQPYQGLQRHMTVAAIALGVAQIPFLIALATARRAPPIEAGQTRRAAIPHAETDVAPWLVAAWQTMFFGSLLSGYVLLRAGNVEWPMHISGWGLALGGATLLVAAAAVARPTRAGLLASAASGGVLVVWLSTLHDAAFKAGHTPVSHLEFASWFTITGVLLTVIAVVCGAAAWNAFLHPASLPARARGLRIVWGSLSLIWLAVLSAFSLA